MFSCELEALTTRRENAYAGCRIEEIRNRRRTSDDLLQVVENQEHLLVRQVPLERFGELLPAGLFQSEGVRDGIEQELLLSDGGKRREEDTTAKLLEQLGAGLKGEARLACATWPGQRE